MNTYYEWPKVSIIMPAYNAAQTISEAIDSILAQKFKDFELIICNDASVDQTAIVLERIVDKRVRVIHNANNLGPGPSRDRAIDIAKGKWLAFTDADDVWLPQRLGTLINAIDDQQNIMVFDNIIECHDTPSGLVPWRTLRELNTFGVTDYNNIVDVEIKKFISKKRYLIKPILPAWFVKQFGIKHSARNVHEDGEFFLNLLAKGLKLRYVSVPMYLYRISPGSAVAVTNRNIMLLDVLESLKIKFREFPDIQQAFDEKIEIVRRDEQYMRFIWSIKCGTVSRTLSEIIKSPWVILELFQRIGRTIAYHSHRILHRGRTRGIRQF